MPTKSEPIFHDRQCAHVAGGAQLVGLQPIAEIPGSSLTTKELGEAAAYEVLVSVEIEGNINSWQATIAILVDNAVVLSRSIQRGGASKDDPAEVTVATCLPNIVSGRIISIGWQTAAGTLTLNDANILIDGIPMRRVEP